MRSLAKNFQALSDINRLRIVKMLEIKPLCVCEIREILGLANSTVSKHLSILRNAEIILDEKEGRWVNYFLNEEDQNEFVQAMLPLLKKWLPGESIVLEDQKKLKTIDRNAICGL